MTEAASRERVFKEGEECVRIHIWLYKADVDWVDAMVAGGWDNATTRSKFIRLSLRKVIRAMQAKADAQATKVHTSEAGLG